MKAQSILDLSATTGRMGREHSEYRGWRLCVAKDRTCIGHGVRESPPHRLVMAEGPMEAEVLEELRRRVDAVEDDWPARRRRRKR